jgi:hypothetical protein
MRVAIDVRRAGDFGIGTYIATSSTNLRAPATPLNIY